MIVNADKLRFPRWSIDSTIPGHTHYFFSYLFILKVQNDNCIVCELFQKKCKSKTGLKRHKTAKHKEERRQDEIEQQRHDFTGQDFICLLYTSDAADE